MRVSFQVGCEFMLLDTLGINGSGNYEFISNICANEVAQKVYVRRVNRIRGRFI